MALLLTEHIFSCRYARLCAHVVSLSALLFITLFEFPHANTEILSICGRPSPAHPRCEAAAQNERAERPKMHWHPTAAHSTLQHIVWGEGLEEAAELGVVGPIETGQSLEREGARTTAYNRELPRESGERDAFEMLVQSRSRHHARMKAEHAFDTAALYDKEADAVAASAPLNPIRP